jgi:hypothetical protein
LAAEATTCSRFLACCSLDTRMVVDPASDRFWCQTDLTWTIARI